VTVCEELLEDARVLARVRAEDEKGRSMFAFGEQLADLRRELRSGTVVEGQRDAPVLSTCSDDRAEQGQGRSERADQIRRRDRREGEHEHEVCIQEPIDERSGGYYRD